MATRASIPPLPGARSAAGAVWLTTELVKLLSRCFGGEVIPTFFGPEDPNDCYQGDQIMQPRLHTHIPGPAAQRRTSSTLIRQTIIIALLVAVAAPGLLVASRTAGAHSPLKAAPAAMLPVDDTQPSIGPGIPQVGSNAPRSNASSTKAGSVLFFHRYTSEVSSITNVNTLITLTNTNPRDGVAVRLYYVHDCDISRQDISLAGNQTRSLLMSNEQPGTHGYVIAVATDRRGVPTQFNWLIGSASIHDSLGHEATYNAFAVAKRTAGSIQVPDGAPTADMVFNNAQYDELPKNVAVDNIQAQSGPAGLFTDMILYTPPASLGTPQPLATQINGVAYEQNGRPYTATVDGG